MEGADSLRGKLNKIGNIDLTQALTQSSLLVENSAKSKCPVDSGQLRRSITHSVSKEDAEVYTNLSYAPYVEYGTGLFSSKGSGRQTPWKYQDAKGNWYRTTGQKPQPFMHPALAENRTKITDTIDKAIKDAMK